MDIIEIYWLKVPSNLSTELRDKLLVLLDSKELQTFERYRTEAKKNEFLIGRAMLKTILAAYLGVQPTRILFVYNAHGKPSLMELPEYRMNKPMYFNLSHSNGMIACAVTTYGPVGIDVELTTKDHLKVMPSVFVAQEQVYVLEQYANIDRIDRFYEIWTRKEAHVKALGEGFSCSPLSFSVLPENKFGIAIKWEYHSIRLSDAYMLSTAIQNKSFQVLSYKVNQVNVADLQLLCSE